MITLQQIAKAGGYSLATVSYALRNDPRISPHTRKRIHTVASELGYRPNPAFSALMSHIRSARPVNKGERIAFVWVKTSREESAKDLFLQSVFSGASLRAKSFGFEVDQFWTADAGVTAERLSDIISARGIVGVILSPVLHSSHVSLKLNWALFSSAIIGSAKWHPELHRAAHHHYLGMQLALAKLEEAGCRSPIAYLETESNERARHAWEAAFFVHAPVAHSSKRCLFPSTQASRRDLLKHCRSLKADALVTSSDRLIDPQIQQRLESSGVRIVSLHWNSARPNIAGVDQRYDLIAANAVDLVVNQITSNERGVPAIARMLLSPGLWVDQNRKVPATTTTTEQASSPGVR